MRLYRPIHFFMKKTGLILGAPVLISILANIITCFTTFLFSQTFDHHRSFGTDGARPAFQTIAFEGLVL